MIKPALELWIEGNLRKTILLNRSVTRIGRSDDNDVVLRNIGISRHHAKIVDDAGAFSVHDLSSANGVLVNREPVEQAALVAGDEILIGKFTLRFVKVDNTRRDLAAGAWAYGDEAPMGMTFEVRGAMARKIREQIIDLPVGPEASVELVPSPSAKSSLQYVLRAMRGDEWLFEKVLEHGVYAIGRSPENDVILASANVSRHHASITFGIEGFTIEDQGSRNGIKMNGQPVESCKVEAGDEVSIGDFRLLFVASEPAGVRAVIDPGMLEEVATSEVGRPAGPEREIDPRVLQAPDRAAETFAFPVHETEVSIQISGWTTSVTFKPDSLRRATAREGETDHIVVRVQLEDGIRRLSFPLSDMEREED